MKQLRVAVIHYWFVTWRGGEKVVESILKMFPQADVYTLFYDESVCGPYLKGHKVFSSSLNTPFFRARHHQVFPLYPWGVKSLKLQGEYDLIISSESGPAKGIVKPAGVPHLCYTHTPMRYCWGFTEEYLKSVPSFLRAPLRIAFERLRRYDISTIDNVDRYIANSLNVQSRIERFYHKPASVVYPPIALDLFSEANLVKTRPSQREYYLSFGALTPYKNIGLLVEAFNASGAKLVVIGQGSELSSLRPKANSNIEFMGQQEWPVVREKIMGAKALLFPGEEDFGMIPLEVMAHGVPVIALKKGGALETVRSIEGRTADSTGVFFAEATVSSLQMALDQFEVIQDEFNPQFIQSYARQYGEDIFQAKFMKEVEALLGS